MNLYNARDIKQCLDDYEMLYNQLQKFSAYNHHIRLRAYSRGIDKLITTTTIIDHLLKDGDIGEYYCNVERVKIDIKNDVLRCYYEWNDFEFSETLMYEELAYTEEEWKNYIKKLENFYKDK